MTDMPPTLLVVGRVTLCALGLILWASAVRFAYLRHKARENTWIDYLVHSGFVLFVVVEVFTHVDDPHLTWRLPFGSVLVLAGLLSLRRRMRLGLAHVPAAFDR
jgi:hypothetical protein